eukprot:1079350-Rhodomonas_salina.3
MRRGGADKSHERGRREGNCCWWCPLSTSLVARNQVAPKPCRRAAQPLAATGKWAWTLTGCSRDPRLKPATRTRTTTSRRSLLRSNSN